jgi:hypothetical protein
VAIKTFDDIEKIININEVNQYEFPGSFQTIEVLTDRNWTVGDLKIEILKNSNLYKSIILIESEV